MASFVRRRSTIRRHTASVVLPATNLFARFIAGQGITAAGGRISQWNDQVGLNHATIASGTDIQLPYEAVDYLGRPVVRFMGDDKTALTFATTHTFNARNVAVFMAGRLYGSGSQTLFGLLNYGGNSGHLRALAAVVPPSTPVASPMLAAANRSVALRPRMNPALFASVSGTTAAVYTNYEAVTGQSAVTTDTDCLGATLGAFNSGSFSSFDAYEVAVYEGSLTAQNITDIRNYFNTTYSLRSSSYVKNIVFEGDSISAGSGVPQAQSYPFKTLRPSLEDWRMSNFSTSGANVTTLTNRGVPTDGFYEPSYGRNVLMVLIGRNDVTNPDNSDAVYAALVAYVQARVTTGWEVWVGTCIATGAALQPAITGLNAKIRGTSGNGIITDAGANRIIDFAALPQFDTTADTTNPTYYQGDSTHPTAAGAVLLADTVAAQMVI